MANINEQIEIAIAEYEKHFNEKAPPMQAVMSLPGIFAKYIDILNDAVKNDKVIKWDKEFDDNSVDY